MKKLPPDSSYLLSRLVLEEPHHVVPPLNWAGHLPFAFWGVEALRPNILVELGTHAGLSYFAFCQAVKSLALSTSCFAVDTWKGDSQAGWYGEEVYQDVTKYNALHYSDFSKLIRSTFDEALTHFSDGSVDILHLDGCHTYEAVKHDFESWLPKLSKRGVVLIHDINVKERDFGSWRLWEELIAIYPSFSFLHSHGLGVLGIGSDVSEAFDWLFKLSKEVPEQIAYTRTFFSKLGKIIIDSFESKRLSFESDRLMKEVALRDVKLESISHELSNRNNQVLTIQHQVNRLREEFGEQGAKVRALLEEVKDFTQTLKELKTQNRTLRTSEKALRAKLGTTNFVKEKFRRDAEGKKKILDSIYNSRSWKISAPLRFVLENLATTPTLVASGAKYLYWIVTFQFSQKHSERKRLKILLESALFDAEYYKSTYPEVPSSLREAGLHYLRHGASQGKNPCPLFDPAFYLKQIGDDPDAMKDPLLHFIMVGSKLGKNPARFFDVSYYKTQNPDVELSGMNPLGHYIKYGAAKDYNPHPLFNTAFYLKQNPEVAAQGLNPLFHFMQSGSKQKLDPSPLFDTKYYIGAYPDVLNSSIDPFVHYLESGGIEGRNPNSLFDGAFYSQQNPELLTNKINPLVHYVIDGAKNGLDPNRFFDSSYYLESYPDVASSGENPLSHFIEKGVFEGRSPHPLFDTDFYLQENSDVADSDLNPLFHYLMFGEKENRPINKHPDLNYRNWFKTYHALTDIDRGKILRRLGEYSNKPLISVILVLEDVAESRLRASLESLQNQLYENWELLVLSPKSEKSVLGTLEEYERADHRIKAVYTDVESAPADTANLGLSLSRGEYVCFIESGSELTEHALYLVLETIHELPQAEVIYTDHDEIDSCGELVRPHFKTDWNQYLFYECNYIGLPVFYRRETVVNIGGFRKDLDAVLHYDLILRLSEECDQSLILHIPFILYHSYPSSRGFGKITFGPTAHTPAVTSLGEHFSRIGVNAKVDIQDSAYTRVTFALPSEAPLVSIIIPTRDRLELLRPCLENILYKTDYPSFEIIVINNESSEPETIEYFEKIQQNPKVRVIDYPYRFNFSAMNNKASKSAKGQVLAFVNNDIEVTSPDWLTKMVSYLCQSDVGVVGAKLYYPDGNIQHAGVIIGKNGLAGHSFMGRSGNYRGYYDRAMLVQELSAVTAACMLVKKDIFESLDGFNEVDLPVAFNDIDLCLKIRERGLRVLFLSHVVLTHHESASLGSPAGRSRWAQFVREWHAFSNRWSLVMANDPYYNPNLSLGKDDYSLAFPPRVIHPWRDSKRTAKHKVA